MARAFENGKRHGDWIERDEDGMFRRVPMWREKGTGSGWCAG